MLYEILFWINIIKVIFNYLGKLFKALFLSFQEGIKNIYIIIDLAKQERYKN
jgi:hypothetical protein